jgi:hypothetical protein
MTGTSFRFSQEEFADLTGRPLALGSASTQQLVSQTRLVFEEINRERDKFWELVGYTGMMFLESAADLYANPAAYFAGVEDEAALYRCIFFFVPKYLDQVLEDRLEDRRAEQLLELKLKEAQQRGATLDAQQDELKERLAQALAENQRLKVEHEHD